MEGQQEETLCWCSAAWDEEEAELGADRGAETRSRRALGPVG